ncbi:hypothetical protein M413DRAFT_444627 [Hebeloma cylindrosporum]|uniref:Uncharacterized protein n=1 Tax=Hebeloma cylindrosporum TaxID=76867 RepID=A0A0C3CD56_HEBCY|nr:hypothetical protein M413DRAFT_444627 [Hebeloma cylindrosporum h7]
MPRSSPPISPSPDARESELGSRSTISTLLPPEALILMVLSIMEAQEEMHGWTRGRQQNLEYLRQPFNIIKHDWVRYLGSMSKADKARLRKRIEDVNKIREDLETKLTFYETTDTEIPEPLEAFIGLKKHETTDGRTLVFVKLKREIVDGFGEGVASIMALMKPEPPEPAPQQAKNAFLGVAAPLSVGDRFLEALPPRAPGGVNDISNFEGGLFRIFVENILLGN